MPTFNATGGLLFKDGRENVTGSDGTSKTVLSVVLQVRRSWEEEGFVKVTHSSLVAGLESPRRLLSDQCPLSVLLGCPAQGASLVLRMSAPDDPLRKRT